MKTIKKKWRDSGVFPKFGSSKIEGLNFDGDRFWTECKVTVKGINANFLGEPAQSFEIYHGNKRIFNEDFVGEKTLNTIPINSFDGFSITGTMSGSSTLKPGEGEVIVECTYDESRILKSKSITWKDASPIIGVTIMENLFLDATETWVRAQVLVEGVRGKFNTFRLQLIKDGSLAQDVKEDTLNGTEARLYTYDINAKETLLVSGYFFNGGAKVTLTGFY